MNAGVLINTPLQRGDWTNGERESRFNGFSTSAETVETVSIGWHTIGTSLKRGVNERLRFNDTTT